MGRTLTAIVVTAAALIALGMLGVAGAEAPTGATPPARTVSVQGVGTLPIGAQDSATEATAVYREAMAKAVADGQSKASFLAGKVEGTVGPAISVAEDGGQIECNGHGEGGEYPSYEGEQPDFGTAPQAQGGQVVAPEVAASSTPVSHRPKLKRRRKRAHTAAIACTLTANVLLVYGMS